MQGPDVVQEGAYFLSNTGLLSAAKIGRVLASPPLAVVQGLQKQLLPVENKKVSFVDAALEKFSRRALPVSVEKKGVKTPTSEKPELSEPLFERNVCFVVT